MLSCIRHCNKSPQKHNHWKHGYYTPPAYHQMWMEGNTYPRASERSLYFLHYFELMAELAVREGRARLFKLHINISRTFPAHFFSVLRWNIQWAVSNFSWCFEDKVRLNSIEQGNFYLIVEFWTVLQRFDVGQLSANNGIHGFYGRGKYQCLHGLRLCLMGFFTHCMMKCVEFKNES